jgi:(1->4)-alpha-D-glucan 1-alpha-D-glucosylmutase
MAKGVEDTVFYRYNRLVSLNEVGGDPSRYGLDPASFHSLIGAGAVRHPGAMLTLSTHDTKRAADVRARIHLLSEIPGAWGEAAACWHDLTSRHRSPAGPDPATEWLTYQTLVGAWPIDAVRLGAYLEKATKEAKVETSWTDPNPGYDAAVRAFAEGVVGDAAVVGALESFLAAHRLVELGRVNSLAQTALLLTLPGVPDVYQGTEGWDLSLVDPDNRRPVDYALRRAALDDLRTGASPGPVATDDVGVTKLWLVQRVLADRARRPDAYADPFYEPLAADGPAAAHAVAFARRDTVVVVPRLALSLAGDWDGTTVGLPGGEWTDVLAGRTWSGRAALQDILGGFPVAVLARSS